MSGWTRLLVVAPAAFAVLPTRSLAGALVGRILPVLFLTAVVLGAALALQAGPRRLALGMGVALSLFSVVAEFGVAPRLRAVRDQAGPALEQLAPNDSRRLAFGRLHGVSVVLLGAGMVAAVLGTWAMSRDSARPTAN